MPIKTVQKIRSIEGLRGALALWVAISHVISAAGLGEGWRGPFKIPLQATNAVDCFIVISGFVIFYLLDTTRETYGKFLWRRILRLYPVYLICLFFYMLLLPVTIQAYTDAPWPHHLNTNNIRIAESSIDFLPWHLTAHLAMLHSLIRGSILPYSNYAIIPPAWSLSLEWQFYVLAPLLFAYFAAGSRRAIAVIAIGCLAHLIHRIAAIRKRACVTLWDHLESGC